MKIGIEASSLVNANPSGIARYIKELAGALLPQLAEGDVLRLYYKLSRWGDKSNWWHSAKARPCVYYKSLWPLKRNIDLLHIPDATLPRWTRTRHVVTIHDLLVLLKDNDFIARKKFREKKKKIYAQMIESATAILAVSQTTKNDIMRLFKVPEEKIHVTYLGVDHRALRLGEVECQSILKKYGLTERYLLFLGAISGRKNTERLVRAFAHAKAAKTHRLVLAGPVSYQGEVTLRAIVECRLEQKVVITGFVPEDHVTALYQGASAFLFPTLYEGFGIPILEAMAHGVPVLAGSQGSAPEISAGHALCIDPYDVMAIAEGIDEVLKPDLLKCEHAREHSRSFTWGRCAKQTLDIYRRLIQ